MVVRGTKPIATLTINDTFDSVKSFMEALVVGQPIFTKHLYYNISKLPYNDSYMVVMYTHPTAFEVFNRISDIHDRVLRDTLYGFLYGYDADSIWAYIDGSKRES